MPQALRNGNYSGLGALSGRSFITGATGSISTVSTTAYATKGTGFVPAADILVTAVLGFVNASAIGQQGNRVKELVTGR